MTKFESVIRSLYLGDRGLKSLLLNGWDGTVGLHVTSVSRVRDPSGAWDYYTEEDIENGIIGFTEVSFFSLSPIGLLPNDIIRGIEARYQQAEGSHRVIISADHISAEVPHATVTIEIHARGVFLEDPRYPGAPVDWSRED